MSENEKQLFVISRLFLKPFFFVKNIKALKNKSFCFVLGKIVSDVKSKKEVRSFMKSFPKAFKLLFQASK